MIKVSFALLIILGFWCTNCLASSEPILVILRHLHSATEVSPSSIASIFCTKLINVKSNRLGYSSFEGSHIDCDLPIASIRLDLPIMDYHRDGFLSIIVDRKICMSRPSLEKEFPGGKLILSPDTARPQTRVAGGDDEVGAEYETLTGRYNCVSRIFFRIGSRQRGQ